MLATRAEACREQNALGANRDGPVRELCEGAFAVKRRRLLRLVAEQALTHRAGYDSGGERGKDGERFRNAPAALSLARSADPLREI